jgi:hypothetical protein
MSNRGPRSLCFEHASHVTRQIVTVGFNHNVPNVASITAHAFEQASVQDYPSADTGTDHHRHEIPITDRSANPRLPQR